MWVVKQSESGEKVNFCLAPSSAMRHFGSTPTSIHPKYVMAAVRKMDRVRISDHMSATNTVHSLHSLPLRPSHFSPIPHADPMHQHHPHLTSFPVAVTCPFIGPAAGLRCCHHLFQCVQNGGQWHSVHPTTIINSCKTPHANNPHNPLKA